jgi:hypothetical protein
MPSPKNQEANFQSPHRPLSYRFFNTLGSGLNAVGLSSVDLEIDSLIKTAEKETQLDDFGGKGFRVPLAHLIDSLKSEAQLNFVGKRLSRKMLLELLMERLRTQHYIKKFPETLSEEINKPLFVIGMPRSGTSFLFNLLCQDPNSSWLRYWELRTPPQQFFQSEQSDQISAEKALIETCSQDLENIKRIMPQLERIHAIDALGPYECFRLLERNFISHTFGLYANIPTYIKWVESECLEGNTQTPINLYHYYRQQVQVIKNLRSRTLDSREKDIESGKNWLFKSPVHLWSIDCISSTFPDASFVHIHRDPLNVIPSVCSFIASGRSVLSDEIDLKAIEEKAIDRWERAIQKALKVRQSDSSLKVIDVHYKHLVENPVETVRTIYHQLNYDFTPELEIKLKTYASKSRKSGRGQQNQYILQQFGIEKEEIYERFRGYYQYIDSVYGSV